MAPVGSEPSASTRRASEDGKEVNKPTLKASSRIGDCAFVFVLYGPKCAHYFLGILVTAWSLVRLGSRHRRVLLYTSDVPKNLISLAKVLDVFHEMILTEYIEAPVQFFDGPVAWRRFKHVFTKWRILELEQYAKVVLLDADLFIRHNIDEIFDFKTPAALVRGPNKPAAGELLPTRAFVNAGVMLMKPDKAFFNKLVKEITGSTVKLPNYNSPDADYLTEHPDLRGQWRSIPLQYNFQLEFTKLDVNDGSAPSVRFSGAREAHFSETGAAMPWEEVHVVHFSGEKPWAALLEDCLVFQRLVVVGNTGSPLREKLKRGLEEYAKEVAGFQAVLATLGLGKGVMWTEKNSRSIVFSVNTELVRKYINQVLQRALPGGQWTEDKNSGCVFWSPSAPPLSGCPNTVPGVYLKLAPDTPSWHVGVMAITKVGGCDVEVEIVSISGDVAEVKGVVELRAPFSRNTHEATGFTYYYNSITKETQWCFPGLPKHYKDCVADETRRVYYHNKITGATSWDPPEGEEYIEERRLEELRPLAQNQTTVSIWTRSFNRDDQIVQKLSQELPKVTQTAAPNRD